MNADQSGDVARLAAWVKRGLQQEISLQAQVYALQDVLYALCKEQDSKAVIADRLDTVLKQLSEQHRRELLIQLEDTNPPLAALLAEEEPFDWSLRVPKP